MELHRALRIPKRTLNSLREAWIANSAENESDRTWPASACPNHQMETLLEEFGSSRWLAFCGRIRTSSSVTSRA